ncbi:hypothetical protein E8E13_001028 [Curvularia kusanoi]|uniref:Uncharacterized protein n=1 Tax=Curvularia kusanoi TaxID=90978 RepID=A0A9P4T4V3_CURKU|nr:hypothetical protein E8E13_001028 [Curvularia kusanoi]
MQMQPGFTLAPRDPFADAKQTLSSWDNCMAKDYCNGSSHKRMKSDNRGYPPPQPQPYPPPQPYASPNPYAEARSFAPPPPPPQPVNTQYSQPAPAMTRRPTNPNFNPQVNPKFAKKESPEQPQFATFDAHSKPVNEDALPEMPSWKNARNVHVEVEEEAVPEKRGDVEMERLSPGGYGQQQQQQQGMAGGAAAGAGMRGSPGPGRSPVSPMQGNDGYGFPASYNNNPNTQYDQRRGSPAQNQNSSPGGYGGGLYAQQRPGFDRAPSAVSYSQYSQGSDQYERRAQQQPYIAPLNLAPHQPEQQPYETESAFSAHQSYISPAPAVDRYNSPAPPSYHTTAQPNPYAYAPPPVMPYNQPQRSNSPGYGAGSGNGYDPVPNRSQTASPSAYPGQQQYQAFTPGGQQSGVARKPVQGSLREV